MQVLVINGGSSSVKFTVYQTADRAETVVLAGSVAGVGASRVELTLQDGAGRAVAWPTASLPAPLAVADTVAAMGLVVALLTAMGMATVQAVGYRVVHPGPNLTQHVRISPQVLQQLEAATELAPLHEPEAVAAVRAMMQHLPDARHYACFDTVFHATMSAAASTYALPAAWRDRGVRRYGFHGLSCESVVARLDALAAEGQLRFPRRLAIAHLGSGCSVTAVMQGHSVDTTMGLTPTGGTVMGTRPGDLDPGVVLYLLRQQKGTLLQGAAAVEQMLNHEAGFAGLAGTVNDMRALRLAAQADSAQAVLALEVFARSVRKALGAAAWVLGGLDAIVFTGGIGENDALLRDEVLRGLQRLGVEMDEDRNRIASGSPRRISQLESDVALYVIPADEDRMVLGHVLRMEEAGGQET
ncbi:MAG: acetate/propionate family kinase [Acidobacteriota bacterium]|nr:acetate/propionate family kinase [Acidobacteriota bacterium]